MSDETTTSRVLRLLTLLQSHRFWPGPELAERLGVSERTLRRDIERLRELDYRVEAVRGVAGGYQLQPGSDLPPLIFTSDEAIALAVALQAAVATTSLAGMTDLTVAAFAKLEQVLPSRLRDRVRAVRASAVSTAPIGTDSGVDPDLLAVLAMACRDHEMLRLSYRAGDGTESRRRVEPTHLVQHSRRWYLLCWDLERQDWRSLRVDRIGDVQPTARRVPPRSLPEGLDPAGFIIRALGGAVAPSYVATIRIEAPLAVAVDYLGDYTSGLEADGPDHTRWTIRSDRLEVLTGALTWLPWDFEVLEAPELAAFVQRFADRVRAGTQRIGKLR
jgi:predicted DNA-binding transcriptional regulator YafY